MSVCVRARLCAQRRVGLSVTPSSNLTTSNRFNGLLNGSSQLELWTWRLCCGPRRCWFSPRALWVSKSVSMDAIQKKKKTNARDPPQALR